MRGYIGRRLLQLFGVVVVASILVWAMVYALPGDPARVVAGQNATTVQLEAARATMALDDPVWKQYTTWIGQVAHGNFGESFQSGQPVGHLISQRLPATLHLAIFAALIGVACAIPISLFGALYPMRWPGRTASLINALSLGIPVFWVGIILALVFGLYLGWLPTASSYISIWEDPGLSLRNLVLPALSLGFLASGILSRFLRASLTEALGSDYVRAARAKGLSETTVVLRHALRNALVPFLTVLGLATGSFIGGAVVTEAVFNYPGLGQLLLQAILNRDYRLIQGVVLLVVVAYSVINILVDVSYAFADPRVRLESDN